MGQYFLILYNFGVIITFVLAYFMDVLDKKKEVPFTLTTVWSLCRQPLTTVIRWASSLWPTRVWRPAAEKWCLMSSDRIRCAVWTSCADWINTDYLNVQYIQWSQTQPHVLSLLTDNVCVWISAESWKWRRVFSWKMKCCWWWCTVDLNMV